MDLADIVEHKKVCTFRPIVCPAARCKTEVRYQQLLEHILTKCKHSFARQNLKTTVGATNETFLKYSFDPDVHAEVGPWKLETLNWKRQQFFLTVKPNGSNNMTNLYIQMLRSSDDCLKYRVRLSICDEEGHDLVSHYDQWSLTIHSQCTWRKKRKLMGGL